MISFDEYLGIEGSALKLVLRFGSGPESSAVLQLLSNLLESQIPYRELFRDESQTSLDRVHDVSPEGVGSVP